MVRMKNFSGGTGILPVQRRLEACATKARTTGGVVVR